MVAAVEHGDLTIGEVAEVFQRGKTFVKKMLRLQRAGEDLAPRHGGGSAPKLTDRRSGGAAGGRWPSTPDVTLAECQAAWRPKGVDR